MARWAEHYQELYSRENIVSDTAIEDISPLPTVDELDSPPTIIELRKAIDSLSCGKAPGSDGISSEILKVGRKNSLPCPSPSASVPVLGRRVRYPRI